MSSSRNVMSDTELSSTRREQARICTRNAPQDKRRLKEDKEDLRREKDRIADDKDDLRREKEKAKDRERDRTPGSPRPTSGGAPVLHGRSAWM